MDKSALQGLNKALKRFDLHLSKANTQLKTVTVQLGAAMKQKINGEDITEMARDTQRKVLNVYLELADCYEELGNKSRILLKELDAEMKKHSCFLLEKRRESVDVIKRMKSMNKHTPGMLLKFAVNIGKILEGLLSSYTHAFDSVAEVREIEIRIMRREDKLSQTLGKIDSLFGIIESFQSSENFDFNREIGYLRKIKEDRIRPYIR